MSGSLTIGQLARRAGLSRTTLLYYEQAGLLAPASRSAAGYRRYGPREVERLDAILAYRATGMPVEAIAALLDHGADMAPIRKRLDQIGRDMALLREQQGVLIRLLTDGQLRSGALDKAGWTAMLRNAGLDDEAMHRWHALFEQQASAAHGEFLASLGLSAAEAARIRAWARESGA